MKIIRIYCTLAVILFCLSAQAQDSRSTLFDTDWRFLKDTTGFSGILGAYRPIYKDKDWQAVTLPHDWSIQDLPGQKKGTVQGPFTKNSEGKSKTGYVEGGEGWYRKKFTLDPTYTGKQVYITFEGVYQTADVWINGQYLGLHTNGYTTFFYDLTKYLNAPGKSNTIAVRARNFGVNSRWYSGSGIYRHVWLTAVDKVHTEMWSTTITTPSASKSTAQVNLKSAIQNLDSTDKTVSVNLEILNPAGKPVASQKKTVTIATGTTLPYEFSLTVANPALWSLETPSLYKARITVSADGKVLDQTLTAFGIRTIEFNADKGFTLNGKGIELKGGNIHHDNGPLGSAAYDRAEERKIELLKKAGFNAVRLSHNPVSSALLDACDRLGMLVMDEAFDSWEHEKVPYDNHIYFKETWKSDLASMIKKDINHPSIILWSVGNEIVEAPNPSGYRIGKLLVDEVRRLDPTRPAIEAMQYVSPMLSMNMEGTEADFEPQLKLFDVHGYNYKIDHYETQHTNHPAATMITTEYNITDALPTWDKVEKLPYDVGAFIWTAIDYMGEAGIGAPRTMPEDSKKDTEMMSMVAEYFSPYTWPLFNSYSGNLDLVGNRKPASYYQNVVWRNSPIEMLVHRPLPAGMKETKIDFGFADELKCWSWPGYEGKKLQVHVYTRAKVVKLELNGKAIAEQTIPEGSVTATFEIDYQPGTLTAKAYDNGKEIASDKLATVGKPAAIRLVADRSTIKADGHDLSYVSVEVVDDKGNIVPNIDGTEVHFEINGEAVIAGVGNGDPRDLSSFQQPVKKVYQGRALVILRSNTNAGKSTLSAKAEGLKSGNLEIITK